VTSVAISDAGRFSVAWYTGSTKNDYFTGSYTAGDSHYLVMLDPEYSRTIGDYRFRVMAEASGGSEMADLNWFEITKSCTID
jgi:hypothetical protein